jgi:hypothetical protein
MVKHHKRLALAKRHVSQLSQTDFKAQLGFAIDMPLGKYGGSMIMGTLLELLVENYESRQRMVT